MGYIKIKIFKAGNGDSFLIEFDNKTTILIDGGTRESMIDNVNEVRTIFEKNTENYILLTHVDNDHIMGLIHIFRTQKSLIKEISGVIYNTFEDLKQLNLQAHDEPPRISIPSETKLTKYEQGVELEKFLKDLAVPMYSNNMSGKCLDFENIKIEILSPGPDSMQQYKSWVEEQSSPLTSTKISDYNKSILELNNSAFVEKNTPTNASSISILISYKDKKLLFLGDSSPSDIVCELNKMGFSGENKLEIDVVKVSHHGSKNNTSPELLEIIKSDKFIISTDGIRHKHQDKECLARIISLQYNPKLIFNYDIYNNIFSEDEMNSGKFKVVQMDEVEL